MLHKNERAIMVVLVALIAGLLLLGCNMDNVPHDKPNKPNKPKEKEPVFPKGELVPYSVCGLKEGQALGTEPGEGGINDDDLDNATGPCLKIREIVDGGTTKWFTSTPSKAFMDYLGYTIDISKKNYGLTYARLNPENGSDGPKDGQFAEFIQVGLDATGSGVDNTGNGGQYLRWCEKLAALDFAGQSNWRRATGDELLALLNFGLKPSDHNSGMYTRFGWPVGRGYWSATDTGLANTAPVLQRISFQIATGSPSTRDSMVPYYASCVSETPLPLVAQAP